ncbi:MAG TPA: glycosyltransferase family 87 protein [Terriglobales bacterium]
MTYRRVVLVLLATSLGTNAYLLRKNWSRLREGYADFTIFYSAGTMIRTGDAARLYDEGVQYDAQRAIAPHVSTRHSALPYNHPPFEAVLFAPLTKLTYFPAYSVWAAVGLSVLGFAFWALRRSCRSLQLPHVLVLLVMALALFPLFMNFFQGQDEALLLALLVFAFVSLRAGEQFWAGVCLGLASFRPQIALALAAVLICARKGRVALGFATSVVMVCALSIAVVGWRAFLNYPNYVWKLEQHQGYGSILPATMPNVRGLVSAVLPDGHPAALAATACASILLLLWGARMFARAEKSNDLELAFSVALLTSALISYHALPYDLSILLIAIFLLHPRITPPALEFSRWQLWLPVAWLFFAPLQMVLWLRLGRFNWFASVLLLWMWGMSKEIAKRRTRDSYALAVARPS